MLRQGNRSRGRGTGRGVEEEQVMGKTGGMGGRGCEGKEKNLFGSTGMMERDKPFYLGKESL